MMRSLYSGVSGIKVHQTKMDVIGNNISNVNTVGFKASTVAFSDVLYQTSSKASGPADSGKTGINAKQIGLGAGLSSITTQISLSGGSQRTDNPFDIMIEGDGFFVVNNGSGNCFTKAGNFSVDRDHLRDGDLACAGACPHYGRGILGNGPQATLHGLCVGCDGLGRADVVSRHKVGGEECRGGTRVHHLRTPHALSGRGAVCPPRAGAC